MAAIATAVTPTATPIRTDIPNTITTEEATVMV